MKRHLFYCSLMIVSFVFKEIYIIKSKKVWNDNQNHATILFEITLVLLIVEVICDFVIKYTKKQDEKDEQNPMFIVLMSITTIGLLLIGLNWFYFNYLSATYLHIQDIILNAMILVPIIFGIVLIIKRKRKTNEEA